MPDSSDIERDASVTATDSSDSAGTAPAAEQLPDLADALRAAQDGKLPERQDASNDDDEDDEDDGEEAAPEQSPEEGSKPDVTPPADESQPRLTRAERRRQEIQQAKDEAAAARQQYETLQAELGKHRQELMQSLGSEQEWNYLVNKRLDPTQTLSYDEEERYQSLHQSRSKGAIDRALWRRAVNYELIQAAAGKGVKLDAPNVPDLEVEPATVVDQLFATARAQAEEGWKDDKARLEADNQSLRTKLAGKSRDPGTGGRSAAGRTDTPSLSDDNAEPVDFFKAGARQREAAGTRR